MGQRENHFVKKEKVFGQFFTPFEVADFIVNFALRFVNSRERAIDPACGDGVFLHSLLNAGFKEVWGVDVDPFVVSSIPSYIKLKAKILVMDALARGRLSGEVLPENHFDLVVGNPPFSSKYGRVSDTRLLQYELGKGRTSQAIEVLFLERFIQLAREGGVIGIILPEGIFASESMIDVRRFVLRFKLLAVISLPRGVFRGTLTTSSKTHILFLKKEPNDGNNTLMLEVRDLNELDEYRTRIDQVHTRGILAKPNEENLTPGFYMDTLVNLRFKEGLQVKTLGELVEEIKTGATEYGEKRIFATSGLRFISAKVVTPLGLDFSRDMKFVKPGSPMDKPQAHVKPGDLLFVRVGVGCSGRACVVIDEWDLGVADDWIYIIRLKDRELLPYYIAVYIQSEPGKAQIDRMKRGVGTVNIPKSQLLKLKTPIPPLNVLQEIKNKYVTMVHFLRADNKHEAQRIFNELVSLVEKSILDNR